MNSGLSDSKACSYNFYMDTSDEDYCFLHFIHLQKSPTYEPLNFKLFEDTDMHLVPVGNQNQFYQCQALVKLHLALCFLLLMTLQLYHLPPPLPPPVSNSSCLSTRCQLLDVSCCTVQRTFQGTVL